MSFTERFVSVTGAGAHDGTGESNAWTVAEAITALGGTGTGIRLNAKVGSYSNGSITLPSGTVAQPCFIRAYNSTIGDLDNQGRNADGTLNTTNLADMTITGLWTAANHVYLQNFDITGALSSALIGDTTVDLWGLINCKVLNTQNNAAASCITGDDDLSLYNCDFECSGAAHSRLVLSDARTIVDNCRFKAAAASRCLEILEGVVSRCAFWGNSGAIGIYFDTISAAGGVFKADRNTFYGIDTAIQLSNNVPLRFIRCDHNHVTDCAKWLDNLGSGSRDVVVIETYNRLRDITTARTGIESIAIGEVSTDAGDHTTDYVDATTGDFHLLTTAAGYNAGLDGSDIGAYQTDPPAGGGGGGTKLAGFGGGMIG